MTIDTPTNNDRLFVVVISAVQRAYLVREHEDFAPFDTIDDARAWAQEQVRANVEQYGSGPNYHADVALIDREVFDADRWNLDDGDMVARATWDNATDAIAWQNDGPFDFSDCDL
jgi:hypothetical protein